MVSGCTAAAEMTTSRGGESRRRHALFRSTPAAQDEMILTVELPQELLHLLRQAPLRLSAMRSALLTANLEGVWWELRWARRTSRGACAALKRSSACL